MTDAEISRAIMSHLYGVKRFYQYDYDDDPYALLTPGLDYYLVGKNKRWRTHKIDAKPVPDFPTDPAAVFGSGGVVEKVGERGYTLELRVSPGGWSTAVFSSGLGFPNSHPANNPCKAVCLAALAALEDHNG